MADRPVLDSDVLIDRLRGQGPGRDLLRELGHPATYLVTGVSAFELALGRSYGVDPTPVRALLAAPCLPLSRAAGVRAGTILAGLRKCGSEIDMRDAMQAGICLEAGLPLVTRNVSHFERVPSLEVVHPERWPPDRVR